MEELEPGQRLLEFLRGRYPMQVSPTFTQLDNDFGYDGALLEYAYRSQLLAMARRLIRTALHIARRYPRNIYGDGSVRSHVANNLHSNVSLDSAAQQKIVSILMECISAAEETISPGDRKAAVSQCRRNGGLCAYCGRIVDFATPNLDTSYTIDHIWPRSLGGTSNLANLAVVCARCNTKGKRDFADAADMHYESFALVSDDIRSYLNDRPLEFDFIVRSRNRFRCSSCDRPSQIAGEILVGRRDQRDSFHMLNMATFCKECNDEE